MKNSKLRLTPKEKDKITISRHAIIVLGALWGYKIFQVRIVFEQYKIPYTIKSMKTTYYRALKNWFPHPQDKYGAINVAKVKAMFETVFPSVKKQG